MTAQQLTTSIASNGYDKLSKRDVMECTVIAEETASTEAQTLVTAAAAAKLAALSDRALKEAFITAS